MTQRKVLIVAGAAGPKETASAILARFGFDGTVASPDMDSALKQLHDQQYDLAIVPLQDCDALQLAALERGIRSGKSAMIIGTAPKADADLIVRAMRSGIQEFLVHPPDPKDLTAAVDRLMRRTRSQVQRGEVMAVYSSKGGLGTTSIAINLAHGLAKHHSDARVSVADLVVTDGDIRVLLNLKPSYDMGDLVKKLDKVDGDLLFSIMTASSGGVWALPGTDSPEFDEMLDGAAITTIVEQLRGHFRYSVLDCEHHMSERTLAAMDSADRVVLVTQLSVPALRSTQRTLTLCRRLGYANEKLCVVVNRYQSGEVLSLADATEVLKCEIFWKLPNDYRTSASAMMKGVPVAEQRPDSKLAWSYGQLAAKLGGGTEIISPNGTNGKHGANGANGARFRKLFGMKQRG